MTARSLFIGTALTLVCASALAAPEPAAEVRELFSAHEQALNGHDLKGLMALYVPGDKTVVMGTTPGERWVGGEQIADAYQHFFADFDPGTIKRDCPWVLSDASGDIGWINATCEYQDSLKGVARTYALNVSAVLRKLDGAWKLQAMHFSNPTAP
ncbi:nuclear transport factor 2 family protein [Thiorhodococcus mannitoliphagus]|uniref:Nuclear transport factor 2 family protein n=1 Tax=Thiorhodococcus mannitoliphagus TaxID=329406 RepID=A0A6P1E0B1_9GAMM|nr:nuclear transport factor 2 family protein [Thiorhodococcus mannitoliphagus]NEX22476.1 nuclear transport factor 2 family protein [Thiorhodococcus mannitoliphagus]